MNRRLIVTSCAVFAAVLAGTSMYLRDDPSIEIAAGWSMSILPGEYERVDNLAFDDAGQLYATLELGRVGRVVRIDGKRGTAVLSDLDRARGLIHANGRLYVSEEVNDGRVISYDLARRQQQVVSNFRRPEGLAVDRHGTLFVGEDHLAGRLLAVDDRGNIIGILARDLRRPEGLAIGGDGEIYIAETDSGRILKYRDGSISVVVDGLREPDQLRVAPDGALWITEDQKSGRLLRYQDDELSTIAGGLRAPQGIAFDSSGRIYVSEQGRNRILVFGTGPVRERDA